MKLNTLMTYLKKVQKLYKSHDETLEFCWHQHFLSEIRNFCFIKKYRKKLHFKALLLILLTLLEFLKVLLIKIVDILMMSAKFATLDLLKIKVTWNKFYGIIIRVHDITNKFYHVT